MAPISRLRWRNASTSKSPTTSSDDTSSSPVSASSTSSTSPTSSSSSSSRPSSSPAKSYLTTTTTVLIGPKQKAFTLDKRLLCKASSFFSEQLENHHGHNHHHHHHHQSKPISLWLPDESSTMFTLFVQWLHHPTAFARFLYDSVSMARETSLQACQNIHWAIVRLHLFASRLHLDKLQDVAMDAIQDLYLECDWDVPPSLIEYLYTQCEAVPAVRVRRWAVAMVAFSQNDKPNSNSNSDSDSDSDPVSDPDSDSDSAAASAAAARQHDAKDFRRLFQSLPAFAADFDSHLHNMKTAGLDVRLKNPQLRISANKLRNDQRLFGFRECSFHSHRAAVGEGRCPHAEVRDAISLIFAAYDFDRSSASSGWSSGSGGGPDSPAHDDLTVAPLATGNKNGRVVGGDVGIGGGMTKIKHVRSISSGLRNGTSLLK